VNTINGISGKVDSYINPETLDRSKNLLQNKKAAGGGITEFNEKVEHWRNIKAL
jgi:hypothetical protein